MTFRPFYPPLLAMLFLFGCGGDGTTGGNGSADLTSAAGDSAIAGDGAVLGDLALEQPDLSALPPRRPFPDTTSTIAILADQLPGPLSAAQQQFVVNHYVGTQKLTRDLSMPLRALKPEFLVLHYHLAIWQSAPGTQFILDGKTWSNDFPIVTQHEDWFWHNPQMQRVASNADGKLLMNIGNAGFAQYWADSFIAQVSAGDYDAVFADSASPALLQGELRDKMGTPLDPRLAGTGARDNAIPELGNKTYIQTWQTFITDLNTAMAQKGVPLIPNTGAFITSWDSSDYSLTAGVFVEGFADPGFADADWIASTNELLRLVDKGKIVIVQNYLGDVGDTAKRMYYLGNYLLVKGNRSYLDYFAKSPLEWYPEWSVDLGAPLTTGKTAINLLVNGVYQRSFEKGLVLVNPTGQPVNVTLAGMMKHVEPVGGGAVDAGGQTPGMVNTTMLGSLMMAAHSAAVFLK